MSFATQAAASDGAKKPQEPKAPVKAVELDGGAALKIMKHCADAAPGSATGQLLGLDIGASLDVTACFPFPKVTADDQYDPDGSFAAEEGAAGIRREARAPRGEKVLLSEVRRRPTS